MTSDMPIGSFFKMRMNNQWTWWQLIKYHGELGYTGIGTQPVLAVTTVYSCVWKKDHLKIAKIYNLKKDLGIRYLDFGPTFPDACERFEEK